jgi:hypothetical protein
MAVDGPPNTMVDVQDVNDQASHDLHPLSTILNSHDHEVEVQFLQKDDKGVFSFRKKVRVTISATGYTPYVTQLDIAAAQRVTVKASLAQNP